MAIPLKTWLTLAGQSQEWFDALPAKDKKRVRESAASLDASQVDAVAQVNIVAQEIEGTPALKVNVPSAEGLETESARKERTEQEAEQKAALEQRQAELQSQGFSEATAANIAQGLPPTPADLAEERANLFTYAGSALFQALSLTHFRMKARGPQLVGPDPQALKFGIQPSEQDQQEAAESALLRAQDFIMGLWEAPKSDVLAIQKRLERAGYLSAGEYQPGIPSNTMQQAVEKAITEATQANMPLLGWLKKAGKAEKERLAAAEGAATASAKVSFQEMAEDRYKQQLLATYMDLWGVAPPPGYIDRAAASGVNFYEFEANERAKPAFESGPRYQLERVDLEAQLAERFGALG